MFSRRFLFFFPIQRLFSSATPRDSPPLFSFVHFLFSIFVSCVFPSLVFHPFLFDVVSALRNWHISRKLTGARALARVDLVSVSTRYLGDINGIKIVHVTAIRYLSPRPRSFVEGTSPPFALIVPRPPLIPPFIVRRNCVSPWNSWRAKKVSKPARCIRTRIVLLLFHQGISTNSTYYAALGELITRRIRYREIKIQTAKCNFAFARFSVSSIFHACVGVSNYPITKYPLLVQRILFVPDFHCKSSEIIDRLE